MDLKEAISYLHISRTEVLDKNGNFNQGIWRKEKRRRYGSICRRLLQEAQSENERLRILWAFAHTRLIGSYPDNSERYEVRARFERNKERRWANTKGRLCMICRTVEATHHHHVVPICFGGTNNTLNRVGLCASCHRKVHRTRLV